MAKQETRAELMQQYHEIATEHAHQKAKVAHMGLDRHEWIAKYSEELIGSLNERTAKDHTWTSAVKWVRDSEDHTKLKRAEIDQQEILDLLVADMNRLKVLLGLDTEDALVA